jgi:predicted ribosome quality control (RQC) complex YloA/Tae2 family protein
MLTLPELQRVVHVLAGRLEGTRLHRSVQLDEYRLVLAFRSASDGLAILISCRPDFARISSITDIPEPSPVPLSFGQYLRAHFHRALFESASVSERDRQAVLRLRGQEEPGELLLSILGARSNVYLLDGEHRIVHSMRPLDETRRELAVGMEWSDPEGVPRLDTTDRWADTGDENYLEAVEDTYHTLERVREIEALSRTMDGVITKEQTFLERKAIHLQEDLAEARRAEEYRRNGELLKSVLHRIHTGDDSVTATDFETGQPVTIPLDSSLSPSENLEKYFGKYQKELRGVAAIEQQIESVQRALERVRSLRKKLQEIGGTGRRDLEAVRELASHPQIRRLIGRHRPEARKQQPPAAKRSPAVPPAKRDIPGRLLPKRYRTEQGLEIWVGRSDEGNDYLTTRLARGNDLFFHLEGYPGSHVVLRTEGKPDPPAESLLDACELAVHFSKMKNAGRADVHVASIKDVKKPKGAKPGLVYVLKGKTIHLRRNPKRLENILASRLDELI